MEKLNNALRSFAEKIGQILFSKLNESESEEKFFDNVGKERENGGSFQDFFLEAFVQRSKVLLPIFLASLLLSVILYDFLKLDYVVLGLLFDILGAYLVATGLLRGKRGIKDATKSHAAVLGGRMSPESMTAASIETVDAIYGVLFLTVGFSLQIIGTLLP